MSRRKLFAMSWVFSAFHRTEDNLPGNGSLLCPATAPAKITSLFTGGRFDALATCYLQGLRVREGGGCQHKDGVGSQ